MTSFPTHTFAADNILSAFQAASASLTVNRRWLGLPRGVYVGFLPSVAGEIVSLAPDSRLGFSSLKVGAQSMQAQVDIFTTGTVTLNFTGHTQFPIYVIARADYLTDAHTQGRILTRATGASGPQEINLCLVNKVGTTLTVDSTVPAYRQLPVAFEGQRFGYMLPGAAEDIVYAQSVTAEVIRARQDIAHGGPPPPTQRLADRLAIDLAADYLATLLGLRNRIVVGNARVVAGGSTSINVSGSFSGVTREFEPKVDIGSGGNETTEGAIVSPDDRAICVLIDTMTGLRLTDANDHPVYGRLSYSTAALPGTLTFTNAQTVVLGVGIDFQTSLQVGDLVKGIDNRWYEVATIPLPTQLTLTSSYLGASVSGTSSRRRFTATLYSRSSGAEAAYTLATPTAVRVFFSAWFRTDRSVFDGMAYMKRTGERPVVPMSSGTTPGRILLAVAGAQGGAIYNVNSSQASIGSNFHTLNFAATNAAVTAAGTGVANVTVPGNQGAAGPGAITGPRGSTGPPGKGLQLCNPFISSGLIYGPGGGPGSMTVDFSAGTPPFPSGSSIAHLVGGFARFSSIGNWAYNDAWQITGMAKMSSLTGRIDFTLVNNATAKFFMGASI